MRKRSFICWVAFASCFIVRHGVAAPVSSQPSRAELLAKEQVPEAVKLPAPKAPVPLPDDWDRADAPISIHFAQALPGELIVRRVSQNDGRLYLQILSSKGPIQGHAEIKQGDKSIARATCDDSLWLSLIPRIGKITFQIFSGDAKDPVQVTSPTTLVEIRGSQIFVNGEHFLIKGATGSGLSAGDAIAVHRLGINLLRGQKALEDCERDGFMSITSLNFGSIASLDAMKAPDSEFEQTITKCLEWLKQNDSAAIASPNTLIVQLGNERSSGGAPPGPESDSLQRRHAAQLIARARNQIKPLAPMLPVGYANQDLTFLTPDCMDVYMHNSFLAKDRYNYPWEDFMKWQGCLPTDGNDHVRPFVNSEFGANRYLPQAYHGGPNNPFLERIHAWNFPNRWAEFMEHGTAGGSIYCLYDLDLPRDQGCSTFGLFTFDRKPKLACWDVSHMWRDFDLAVEGDNLVLTHKRDYWARNIRLTLSPENGKVVTREIDDIGPKTDRRIALKSLFAGDAPKSLRWSIDFTTHSGLPNAAIGAWPTSLEEADFLKSLQGRDTYPLLSELFDTEVLTADGKPAPRTLAEMTNADGIIPVAMRKRNGVTYLLLITRENADKHGPIRHGINLDVAFKGKVTKVDDTTRADLPDTVEATSIQDGLRLTNLDAARIPGAIGQRCQTPFKMPVYKISP